MIPDSAALKLASLGPRMFQRHEVLRADDGHTFRNPVREELPTIHPESCPSTSRTTFADLEDEVKRLEATSQGPRFSANCLPTLCQPHIRGAGRLPYRELAAIGRRNSPA